MGLESKEEEPSPGAKSGAPEPRAPLRPCLRTKARIAGCQVAPDDRAVRGQGVRC